MVKWPHSFLYGLFCTVLTQSHSSLAVAMILSAVSVFTIWSVPDNHAALVGVSCLFSAVTVTVFGALNVVNIVTYDVDLRYYCNHI